MVACTPTKLVGEVLPGAIAPDFTLTDGPTGQVVSLSAEPSVAGRAIDEPAFQLAAAFIPGRSALYLFGSMPVPRAHSLYQVWLHRSGRFASGCVESSE